MKHCHCGFHEHARKLKIKNLGIFGAVFFVLHLLYHVVECLILPALFIAFTQHPVEGISRAESQETLTIERHTPEIGIFSPDLYDSCSNFWRTRLDL